MPAGKPLTAGELAAGRLRAGPERVGRKSAPPRKSFPKSFQRSDLRKDFGKDYRYESVTNAAFLAVNLGSARFAA
jgi:hypothetical protein